MKSATQTGLPIEKVTAALAMMELKGMVRQVGGMHYVPYTRSPLDMMWQMAMGMDKVGKSGEEKELC